MATKYTPGPWQYGGQKSAIGTNRFLVVGPPGQPAVANVWDWLGPVSEANANLIAESPTLLECLEWALARLNRMAPPHAAEGDGELYRFAQASASIRRANGTPKTHKRKCWDCGAVAEHSDCVAPEVCCKLCGSQDTRKVKASAETPQQETAAVERPVMERPASNGIFPADDPRYGRAGGVSGDVAGGS